MNFRGFTYPDVIQVKERCTELIRENWSLSQALNAVRSQIWNIVNPALIAEDPELAQERGERAVRESVKALQAAGKQIVPAKATEPGDVPADAVERYFDNPEYLSLKNQIKALKEENTRLSQTVGALSASKRHALQDVYNVVQDLIKKLPYSIQSGPEMIALLKAIGDYRVKEADPLDMRGDVDHDLKREAANSW